MARRQYFHLRQPGAFTYHCMCRKAVIASRFLADRQFNNFNFFDAQAGFMQGRIECKGRF